MLLSGNLNSSHPGNSHSRIPHLSFISCQDRENNPIKNKKPDRSNKRSGSHTPYTIHSKTNKLTPQAAFRMYLLQDLPPSRRAWTRGIVPLESTLKPHNVEKENI